MATGNWKQDFYQVFETFDGVVQTAHVFVGHDNEVRTEEVGIPLTAEEWDSYGERLQ